MKKVFSFKKEKLAKGLLNRTVKDCICCGSNTDPNYHYHTFSTEEKKDGIYLTVDVQGLRETEVIKGKTYTELLSKIN